MDWTLHALVSLVISVPLFLEGRPDEALPLIFVGILMDVDHVVDYFILTGKVTWDIARLKELKFKNFCCCPLHSWELTVLYTASFFPLLHSVPVLVPVIYGAAIGWGVHMLFDMVTNEMSFSDLSLIVRWRRGWSR